MTKTDNTEYWAEQLQENTNEIAPLLSKMYEQHCNLSIEDQYVLREMLNRNASLVSLLNENLPKPKLKPYWKRIVRI